MKSLVTLDTECAPGPVKAIITDDDGNVVRESLIQPDNKIEFKLYPGVTLHLTEIIEVKK